MEDDSILTSVKRNLGIVEEYTHFDQTLITHINSVFSVLLQLGVGPGDGFTIQDKSAVWTDFIPASPKMELIKTYMYEKVRVMFDPPMSSIVMEATNRVISELEWRINVAAEIEYGKE